MSQSQPFVRSRSFRRPSSLGPVEPAAPAPARMPSLLDLSVDDRILLAYHSTDDGLVEQLALRDPAEIVRLVAIESGHLTIPVLRRLAGDRDPDVASTARLTLLAELHKNREADVA